METLEELTQAIMDDEQNKTYKLSCNKLMLKGNEYYRIVSAF